jgi:thioredoxin 1
MKKWCRVVIMCFAVAFSGCAQQVKHSGGVLDAVAFEKALNETSEKQIVDVRTIEEYAGGFIPGASLIDYYDSTFIKQIQQLDRNKPVFVYCQGGGRSAKAAELFRKQGFTLVYDLKGGMMSWEVAGRKVEYAAVGNKTEIEILPNHIYTKDEYNKTITGNLPVLIDFYAKWCEPCKKMAPVIEKLQKEFEGKVIINKIDVDDAKELCKTLKIEGIPVIHTYKNGKLLANKNGYQSEDDFRKLINELLK